MQEKLPHLFSFSTQEDISIFSYIADCDPSLHFALPLSVEANSELTLLNSLVTELDSDVTLPDVWSYTWGATDFSARKYYKFYFRNILPAPALPLIWKTNCTMKHKVFAWLLFLDRLNTRDMLVRRNCPVRDVNCVVCHLQRETREHLFFACQFSTSC